MCGITGFIDLVEGISAPDRVTLQSMTDTLVHRGPDADGYFVDDFVALGHRRLSIIDLSGGDQPITNEDGSVVLIFNGQIYNYQELRQRLVQSGHQFKTQSDTEVIVHLYEEEGNRCVELMRGMFAFAIWDKKKRKLFLARDRLGIKPLYYTLPEADGPHPNRLLFGSELKAILQGLKTLPAVDPLSVVEFMTFLYVPAPRSIFQGIKKLPPASWLEITPEGTRVETYWDVIFDPRPVGLEEAAGQLGDLVSEAVDMRLMSEVPLGAFLSGGTDSAAVVWAMSQARGDRVKTVTVGFSDAEFDERSVARGVAKHLNSDHEELEVQPSALPVLELLSWHYDEPFGDSSLIPTYYVSKAARQRVTVALSGDGGDENFAGYRRYRYDVLENRLRSFFPGVLRQGLAGLGALYPKADWLPRPLRAKTLLTHLGMDPAEAYYRSVSPIRPEIRDRVLSQDLLRQTHGYDPLDRFRKLHREAPAEDLLSKIQYIDLKTYLVDDILTKVDRASMAVSLEVRVPLLDHKIVEFAARLPVDLKLARDGTGKAVLREMLRTKIPAPSVDGRKKGFSIPLRRWIREEFSELMEDRVLSNPAPFFDGDVLRSLYKEHCRGIADHSTVLFGAVVYHLWQDRFLTGGGKGRAPVALPLPAAGGTP